jgi:PPOX class probable F420-dependent enzyme
MSGEIEIMVTNALAQFQKKNYLSIESYRKSGEPVRTPVWFVEDGGSLFVRTGPNSGKVKRLKRNPNLKVVPCSMGGAPQGTWAPATFEIVSDEQQAGKINSLFNKKYGLQKAILELFEGANRNESVTLKLQLTEVS